ncbi:MAG: TraB/GumN family protein [Verrucomicrobiales bacterium]
MVRPVYKITDADSTVYLAGSVHMLWESDLLIPGAIMQAYEDSQRLV